MLESIDVLCYIMYPLMNASRLYGASYHILLRIREHALDT